MKKGVKSFREAVLDDTKSLENCANQIGERRNRWTIMTVLKYKNAGITDYFEKDMKLKQDLAYQDGQRKPEMDGGEPTIVMKDGKQIYPVIETAETQAEPTVATETSPKEKRLREEKKNSDFDVCIKEIERYIPGDIDNYNLVLSLIEKYISEYNDGHWLISYLEERKNKKSFANNERDLIAYEKELDGEILGYMKKIERERWTNKKDIIKYTRIKQKSELLEMIKEVYNDILNSNGF